LLCSLTENIVQTENDMPTNVPPPANNGVFNSLDRGCPCNSCRSEIVILINRHVILLHNCFLFSKLFIDTQKQDAAYKIQSTILEYLESNFCAILNDSDFKKKYFYYWEVRKNSRSGGTKGAWLAVAFMQT